MNMYKEKLENCKLDPKDFYGLNKNEVAILEGLLFAYSPFGGKDLVLNPEKTLKALSIEDKKQLINTLRSNKSHMIGKAVVYQNEKEIIEYYNLFSYDQKGVGPYLDGFNRLHKAAEEEEANIRKILKIITKQHDEIIDYEAENRDDIISLYKEKSPELNEFQARKQFYIDVKNVFANLEIDKLDLITPNDKISNILSKNFISLIN